MKIWFISHTHTRHAELTVPRADGVIHCGDEANVRKRWMNQLQSKAFFDWFVNLEIETKIFVPGNHSTAIAEGLITPAHVPSVHFLIHESMELGGLRIFGSPYTPAFFNWAYNKGREELDSYWAEIPSDTDLLITHGPPKGIRDVTRHWRTKEPIHVGSKKLTRHVIERIQLRIHAFGHLRDEAGIRNFGCETRGSIPFINAACCDLKGTLVNHGMVVDVKPEEQDDGV